MKTHKSRWPERQDGKLNWLQKRLDEAEGAKARAEAQTDLDNYMKLVRQGGY